MSNKKNIDRLFQEKFKDFEVTPNDAVWDRISESLPNKKKKRRVVALWWQIGGVAAVIALLLTVGVSVFNNNPTENQNTPIVDVEIKGEENNSESTEDVSDDNTNEIISKKEELISTDENTSKVADNTNENASESSKEDAAQNTKQLINNITSDKLQKTKVADNSNKTSQQPEKPNSVNELLDFANNKSSTKVVSNTTYINKEQIDNSIVISNTEMKDVVKNELEKSKNAVAENNTNETVDNLKDNSASGEKNEDAVSIFDEVNKQSVENAIAENDKANNEKEKDKQNRWSIAPNVAPVYFSSLGQGSPVHSQFNENSKSSDINMSYGIAGSYAITERLKVRAGVNRVNLNYTTADVIGFVGSDAVSRGVNAQLSNVDLSNGVQSVSLVSTSMINRATMPEAFNTQFVGDLDQRFGFIEVPFELEYRLLDSRFGVNFIGGFSTFFLSENEIYADINGSSTLIGEANNINSTSFSANFGLGLDYSLSKKWNFNLEPTFKYQLNTFNNTSGNFRPFFIGVYTGLSFKF